MVRITPRAAAARWLDRRPGRILIGVSGGADSTALCVAAAEELEGRGIAPASRIIVAHYNHRLRAEPEHRRDLEQVRAVASRRGLPVVIDAAAPQELVGEAQGSGGLESAARRARHAFFERSCRLVGASTIWTAHTADDQQETVLMRLLAGVTSPLLAGIPEERTTDTGVLVCRPLLRTSREHVERFLHDRGICWSEDATNRATRFRRNRTRLEVLPAVEQIWPAVRNDLLRLAEATGVRADTARARAKQVPTTVMPGIALVDRGAFYTLGRDARLELLYTVLQRAGLLSRRDRPSHRFFNPLLGPDPGGKRTLVHARGLYMGLSNSRLLIVGRIVRPRQSGYLRGIG